MKNLRRRDHGMTLLELILVVGILALISGMTTAILLSVRSTWTEIQARTAAARAGWRLARDLSEQLRMALDPDRGWAMEGTDASRPLLDVLPHTDQLPEDIRKMYEAEQCNNDTLTFAASRVGFGRRVYPGWLHYRIEYDEKTGECLGLFRRTTPLNRDIADAQREPVSEYIVSLDLSYQNAQGNWVSEWHSSDELPQAVRVTVGTLPRRKSLKHLEMNRYTTVVTLQAGRRISQ